MFASGMLNLEPIITTQRILTGKEVFFPNHSYKPSLCPLVVHEKGLPDSFYFFLRFFFSASKNEHQKKGCEAELKPFFHFFRKKIEAEGFIHRSCCQKSSYCFCRKGLFCCWNKRMPSQPRDKGSMNSASLKSFVI